MTYDNKAESSFWSTAAVGGTGVIESALGRERWAAGAELVTSGAGLVTGRRAGHCHRAVTGRGSRSLRSEGWSPV